MLHDAPSRTAYGAARHRAVHQVVEHGAVFTDPHAVTILGRTASDLATWAAEHPRERPLRLFIACRHRFADDVVAAVVAAHGAGTQLVVLGAGLDTTAYRADSAARALRVLEVDHPATAAWKRDAVAAAGLCATVPVAHVAVDLERQDLATALADRGFDPGAPTVVSWLGVVPYLTVDAVAGTLSWLATLADAHLVADYSSVADPQDSALAVRVRAAGEPLRSSYPGDAMARLLGAAGLRTVEDLDRTATVARYLGVALDRAGPGPHLLHAATPAAARYTAHERQGSVGAVGPGR